MLSKNVKLKTYITKMLSVVSYTCANLSLTLREEHTLSVSENMALRICGHNRDKIIGG
jgi:hypothetical protein